MQFSQYIDLARRIYEVLFLVTAECDESTNTKRLTSLERVRGVEDFKRERKKEGKGGGERERHGDIAGFESGVVLEGEDERRVRGWGGGLWIGKVESKAEKKGKLVDPNVLRSIREKFDLLDPDVVGKELARSWGSKRGG